MRNKTIQISLDEISFELAQLKADLKDLKNEINQCRVRDNHLLSWLQHNKTAEIEEKNL